MFWHFNSLAKSKHQDACNCNDISWLIMCAKRWCYSYFWKAKLTFREHVLFGKWYDDDFSCLTFFIQGSEKKSTALLLHLALLIFIFSNVPSNNIQQLAHCMHISSRGEADVTGKETGHLDTMQCMWQQTC